MAQLWPSRVFLAAIGIVASLVWGFVDVLTSIAHAAWRFIDIPAYATLAFDRLAREFAVVRDAATAFKAFAQRALSHPSYTAGHFDPGRMPA